MKHTPGPWTSHKTEYGYYVGSTEPTKPVADVHLFCVDNREPQVWSHVETQANAHLIAASPELLEALSEAWGYVLYYVYDPNTQDKDAADVLRKMDAAIRKARGES